jgi:glycosyltransferase involved in cell wall biosynthesis
MRLLFDLFATQPYGNVKYNGGAEYVRRVFLETINKCDDSVNIFCTYNSNFPFDNSLRELSVINGVVLLDIAKASLIEHVRENKIDKIFLGIVQRYNNFGFDESIKVIMVWHDVRNLEISLTKEMLWNFSDISTYADKMKLFVKLIFFKFYLKRTRKKILNDYKNIYTLANKKNTRILTDSIHSKYMILSNFPNINKNKIDVMWAPELAYPSDKISCPELSDQNYWLLVGADRWEKNALPVIEILLKINSSRKEKIKLVLVGSLNKTNLYHNIKKYDWIIIYDYLERSKLEWLYANCSVFLYPSFVEGFGYPPIEAMKYNKPIVASATSSIMEVCGEAPLYICPYNKMEIESRFRLILDMDLELLSLKSSNRYIQILERQHCDLENIVNMILT